MTHFFGVGSGGRGGGEGIEGAKAARLECTSCWRGTVSGPHSVSYPSSLTLALKSRHRGMQLAPCLLHRGSGLRLVMLECPFCWLVRLSGSLWWGLLAWLWLQGWDGTVPTWSRSECIACAQISGVCSPHPPSSLYPAQQSEGCKGVWKGSGIVVIVGAASPGAYRPLTDLGKCSSGERAQGTPHSCAALAPMLAEKHRSTW